MATPEGVVKTDVKKYLKSRGVWHFSPPAHGFGRSVIPDIICCHRGKLVAIEVKAPGKMANTTTMQDREIEQINDAGGIALVVDNWTQLKYIFEGAGNA